MSDLSQFTKFAPKVEFGAKAEAEAALRERIARIEADVDALYAHLSIKRSQTAE